MRDVDVGYLGRSVIALAVISLFCASCRINPGDIPPRPPKNVLVSCVGTLVFCKNVRRRCLTYTANGCVEEVFDCASVRNEMIPNAPETAATPLTGAACVTEAEAQNLAGVCTTTLCPLSCAVSATTNCISCMASGDSARPPRTGACGPAPDGGPGQVPADGGGQ